jgi:cytoskeletal protein CcmA (bactofilin family)
MFKMARKDEGNNPERLNRIVEGTLIEGQIKSESNIRIDGHVKGITTTKGRLVIGPNGFIEGEIVCKNADVEGNIKGKITVTELLSLKATSKIEGDIVTKKLAIEPGAVFNGTCSMGAVVKDMIQKDESKRTAPLAQAR